MRLSEQYALRVEQVDLDRRTIDLTKTKNFNARAVDLNSDAIAALQSLQRPGQRPNELVFLRDTKGFDNGSWFNPCLSEAEISDYVWHSNRHTFCSWLAMKGATTREIQDAAGFKTIAMAARYAHLSPSHRLSVVDRITDAAHGDNERDNH